MCFFGVIKRRFNMPINEEKYFATSPYPHGEGNLVNKKSGKAIPPDEPVFVLRAQDINAVHMLREYRKVAGDWTFKEHIDKLIEKFETWQRNNSHLVKIPD